MAAKTIPDSCILILEGIMGSKAYGLDTPESDEDRKGLYMAPTVEMLGLRHPEDTVDSHDPDYQAYELEKYFRLAAAANPTLMELMWLDSYTLYTGIAHMLVENRKMFLSNTVRDSYGGYAIQQVKRLERRNAEGKEGFSSDTAKRTAKHARHCFRLLLQGGQLLSTGTLRVKVTPEEREHLFALGELPVAGIVEEFEKEFDKFNQIESVLPDQPDWDGLNDLLQRIRLQDLVDRGVLFEDAVQPFEGEDEGW